MVMEVWTEGQEWPIDLPAEPPHERVLQARGGDDFTVEWRWRKDGWYSGYEYNGDYQWEWSSIVEYCIRDGARLRSLPPDTPGVPGGTTPRED